ncbi:MAG: 3-hydroxyacyl-CoA dehydrogenase family protein [Thermomicrobiales bacterium]|nr:3-hydroxyacyl-CoA dehydrogenase family protein [Thermomicrobiales bacterium]
MTGDTRQTVAVMGSGTMGSGIAATFARHGFQTRLYDVQAEQLEKAKDAFAFVCKTLIGGGFMTEADAETARANLTYTLDLNEALAGVDFVAETVPEKLEIKQAVFKQVEPLVSDEVIIASNTSGIPITTLAEVCQRPNRVIGMHWSNPPHLIPVIEVIRGRQTDDATTETTKQVVERLGMIPAVVDKDVPGFVENRILYAIMREALHLLDEGVASAEAIDTIAKWGIGYKLAVIGPLELLDVAGLDIYTSVAAYLNPDLSCETGVSATVADKVAAGKLGIKTQGGLFDYTPERIQELQQQRGKLLLASKKALTQA